jgi:hypothetical protein
VKIVLPVIANPDGDGKFGIDADGVFVFLEKVLAGFVEVSIALLDRYGGGRVVLKGGEAGEGVGAALVGEIVRAAAADIRNVDAEIKKMLAVNPGDDVGAVEMVFRAAGIGLRAAAGKSAGDDDLLRYIDAGARLIVLPYQETKLVDPVG